jgi:glutamate/tyrosine decarboxylase-like PLP-dependent enzyme
MAEAEELEKLQHELAALETRGGLVLPVEVVRLSEDERAALCDRLEREALGQEEQASQVLDALRTVAVPNVKRRRYKKN